MARYVPATTLHKILAPTPHPSSEQYAGRTHLPQTTTTTTRPLISFGFYLQTLTKRLFKKVMKK